MAVTSTGSAPDRARTCWHVARVGPGEQGAVVTHLAPHAPPSPAEVRGLLAGLRADGVREVLTGALSPLEAIPYLAASFEVAATLLVLTRDLHGSSPPSPRRRHRPFTLRTARPADEAAVLELDHAAFPPLFRLDATGLFEARRATPRARYRVALGPRPRPFAPRPILGYAITGQAGANGFLQRLAVAPGHRREGIGRLLVADGLSWLRRQNVKLVAVNTEPTNEAAVGLYQSLGFRPEANGLVVLRASLR